jgi:hypothetical protein
VKYVSTAIANDDSGLGTACAGFIAAPILSQAANMILTEVTKHEDNSGTSLSCAGCG